MCGSNINEHTILGKRLNKSQGAFPQKKTGITTTIVRCNNCQLVFSNPLPIPANLQDHYGVPPENYWKPEYFEMDPNYFKNEIETLKTLKKIELNTKALDIGAGLGKCMIALKNAGFDAYGLEPSKPFYQQAIDKLHIPEGKLKLCSIEEAEYPENEFDFITFGAVLEHLYDPSDSIKKAIKWLKPGGIVHIEVPSSKWFINKLINFAYNIRGLDYVGNISPMHTPFHLYEFGIKSFELNGKANKYSIIHQQHFVCETYMPKVIDVITKPYMKMTNTGMQLVVWLKKDQ
ncbi:MAG: methyltransferase domain-containing protein [Bacteroidetes bacterium]|nr:methyltransferase domain-containing protein [Bacteroidota bacterium]